MNTQCDKIRFERVDDLSEEDIRNYMSGNDYEQKIIATLTEILTGKTVNPTIITDGTPVGNVYYGPVSIEINHPTENYSTPYTAVNRKIYYTINGNTPVPGSAGTYLYTGPVVLNPTNYTVKAICPAFWITKETKWTYTSGIVSASHTVNNTL